MLIHEQDVVLEARIKMWLKAQVHNDRVVVAIDVGVDSVESFEELAEGRREVFRKGDTDAGREGCFVINIRLYPGHQVLDVFGRGHLGGAFVGFGVLPEVFESVRA
jgi:hypothetical protein